MVGATINAKDLLAKDLAWFRTPLIFMNEHGDYVKLIAG